jgi:hypothetical protein
MPTFELSGIVQTMKAILTREEWWQAHKETTSLLWGAINYPDPVVLDITQPEESTHWIARLLRALAFLLTFIPRLLHRVVLAPITGRKTSTLPWPGCSLSWVHSTGCTPSCMLPGS